MAGGITGNTIRSRTGYCNQEDRLSVKLQQQKIHFGIYQPLTAESISELEPVLEGINDKVQDYLDKRRPSQDAEFKTQSRFGVTYMLHNDGARAVKQRMIDPFAVGRIMEAVDEFNDNFEGLEVPLGDFSWYGSRGRKLAARIGAVQLEGTEEAKALEQLEILKDTTKTMDAVLCGVGATVLTEFTRQPDHVSFATFETNMPLGVGRKQRSKVEDLFYEAFDESNITSVQLGGLVVGSSYTDQLVIK